MARKVGTVLSEEHRIRVASGGCSVAELASELGIARQSLHAGFRKRGWSTRPELAGEADHVPEGASEPPGAPIGSEAPEAPATAESCSTAAAGALAALPAPTVADADDLAELTRQSVATAALLAVAQAHNLLARTQLSAQSLKATVAAIGLALDQLARVGMVLDGAAAGQAPRMVFAEYSPEEVAAIQAEAERAHHGIEPVDLGDGEA